MLYRYIGTPLLFCLKCVKCLKLLKLIGETVVIIACEVLQFGMEEGNRDMDIDNYGKVNDTNHGANLK